MFAKRANRIKKTFEGYRSLDIFSHASLLDRLKVIRRSMLIDSKARRQYIMYDL